MNVLYILSSTDCKGGASKSFLTMIKGLKEKGISITVAIPNKMGLYSELQQIGVKTIIIPIRPNIYPPTKNSRDKLLFIPRFVLWQFYIHLSTFILKWKLENQEIDLIHTNVSIIDIGFRLSKFLRIPHILHIREYGDKDFDIHYFPSKHIYIKKFLRSNSYFIAITKDILKYHNLSEVPSAHVIYNGIYQSNKQNKEYQKEKYLLYAGRIEPAKGLDLLLDAYNIYIKKVPEVLKLVIIGKVNDFDYYKKIYNYINLHDLKDNVVFLGQQNNIEIFMQKATAIIIPSRAEGFGRCMTEAMFNKCLVIGNNTAGTKEQFDNGRNITGEEIGIRYNSNKELSDILIGITKNPDSYKDYIERAEIAVRKLYSTDTHINNIFKLYKNILYKK